MYKRCLIVCLMVLPSLCFSAQRIETDWLKTTVGFKEDRIGAEILSVIDVTGEDMRQVKVAIPQLTNRRIEEVVVIGEKPKKSYGIKLDQVVEVIHDMDNDITGVVIRLHRDEEFKLLINYFDYSK